MPQQAVSRGAVAVAVAAALYAFGALAPNAFWAVVSPAFRASDALASGTRSLLAGFGNTAALAARNEDLARENAALVSQNEALRQNSADVTALLDAGKTGIVASVVARPPESPYDTLVLAAGAKSGVARGMEAFAAGGVPVGIVSEVLDDFSRVTLFSSPGVVTDGWVGQANVPLTLRGAGGGAFSANVAREAGIAAGAVVSVPGPGQLPVGSVVRVDSDPLSPSVTLRIAPAANLFSIAWVSLRATGVPPGAFASSTAP